jgi:hypothetical protein
MNLFMKAPRLRESVATERAAAAFFAAVLIGVSASPVRAQTCLGLPSFETGSVHLNVSGEFPDSAKGYAFGIGAGKPDNLFANAGGGFVTYEGFTEKSKIGFLELGYQLPFAGFQLCPVVGGYIAVGPDDPTYGITVTSTVASFGMALGRAVSVGSVKLVPNIAAKFDHLTQKLKIDDEVNPIEEYSDDFDSSVLDLGLAVIFRDRVSVQPIYHLPLSGDQEDPSFGVFLSFAFGWRATP